MARNIKELHPRLQEKVEQLKTLCTKEGLILGIGECFRSVAEQDALYAQGRTKPGNIVTNAKGSTYSSQHQWGIAVDFFKNVKGHAYDDASFFSRVGTLAKSIGLAWGGDWKGFVDKPHLYLPDWGADASKLKKQYGNFENFKKTWNTVPSQSQPVTSQPVQPKPVTPTPSVSKDITFKYRVKAGGKWYSEVTNLNDYAGVRGRAITDIAIGVTQGAVRYRVHVKGGNWLPYVTGYNIYDGINGYAGNGNPIDAIEVYYTTPSAYAKKYGYKKATYRVSPVLRNYYSWQTDTDKKNGMDGYAGSFGKKLDRFQIYAS